MKKFFTNTIIQVYLRILEQYKYNDLHINHCVIKLLHRLSTLRIGELGYGVDEDNEYRHAYGETILYQVAYMDLFERILEDKNLAAILSNNAREFAAKTYDLKKVCLPKQLNWIREIS